MSLFDRHQSYQWAQIERKLLDQENLGFVRPIDPQGIIFCLDPSPFLHTQKRVYYIAQQAPPPPPGNLIRVSVQSEEEEIKRDRHNIQDGSPSFHRDVYKFIHRWETIDPNLVATKRKIIEPYELMEFFRTPFIGDEDYIARSSTCAALSFLSAPPLADEKGGINTAVLGKPKFWKAFEQTMSIIPAEFKRKSSDYFYLVSKNEKEVRVANNKEVNLTFHNPEQTPMHIPLLMNPESDFITKYHSSHMKKNEYLVPFMVSYLIDSLLFKPSISLTDDRLLTDSTYRIKNDIASAGYSPCNLDIGSILPKMSLAFSRLNSEMIVKSDDIKSSEELWLDSFYEARKYYSTPFSVEDMFKMSDNERRLYMHLVDVFGIEHLTLESEFIDSVGSIRMSRDQYDESIEILNRFGLVLRYHNNIMKLLDSIEPKKGYR